MDFSTKGIQVGEQILWQGKPEALPFFLDRIGFWFCLGVLVLLGVLWGAKVMLKNDTTDISMMLFASTAVVFVVVMFFVVSSAVKDYKKEYIVTDQRIINSYFPRNFTGQSGDIYYKDIIETRSSRNLADTFGGTVSTFIYTEYSKMPGNYRTGGGYIPFKLSHLKNAYEVLNIIEAQRKINPKQQ